MSQEKREIREAKLASWRERHGDPYSQSLSISHLPGELLSSFEEIRGHLVSTGGRVLAMRKQGKLAFLDLGDLTGRIQLFFRANENPELFEDLDLIDLGDLLWVEGELLKTKRGQVSVGVDSFQLVAKGRIELPDKREGISDPETRLRLRWVDMATGGEIGEDIQAVSRILGAARAYWSGAGFMEVTTPLLHPVPGGAYARPFSTHHNALDLPLYLRVAPELYLKKLLVAGCPKLFEIGSNFRNEGLSRHHNPEFLSLEAYEAWGSLEGMMERTEGFLLALAQAGTGKNTLVRGGEHISLEAPFARVDLREELIQKAGVNLDDLEGLSAYEALFVKKGLPWHEGMTVGRAQDKLYSTFVESTLLEPTFVVGYPKEMSPLAREMPDRPGWVERFELVIARMEVANAFGELADPDEQRSRMEAQALDKEGGDGEAQPVDDSYLDALAFGMPPAGGIGFGLERLMMLLLDKETIRDVILFPLLRPKPPR
ncbi:lysine--tRNA ligase [bacterium]|nr:lysine--tRNA ligase [bacterium]